MSARPKVCSAMAVTFCDVPSAISPSGPLNLIRCYNFCPRTEIASIPVVLPGVMGQYPNERPRTILTELESG